MGKFFLGVLTGVAGTVAVTATGKNLYRKNDRFLQHHRIHSFMPL